MRRTVISVCGQGQADDPALVALAEGLGAAIATAGCTLACGGLGGVMEAACRGVRQARERGEAPGALAMGILPGESAGEANAYCDLVLPTGMGIARNLLVVRAGDAIILVGGGSGTLAEAAYAWQLGKPVVALAHSGGWAEELSGRAIDGRRVDRVLAAQDPDTAVQLALSRVGC